MSDQTPIPSGHKPILQALLIADHIYQDRKSGKMIIAGTFTGMFFISKEDAESPEAREAMQKMSVTPGHRAGSPYAYINLTEVHGTQDLKLRYVNLEDDSIVFQFDIKVQSNSPLATHEIHLPLPTLPQKEGVFALELLWQEVEPLGSTRITVKNVKGEGPQEQRPDA